MELKIHEDVGSSGQVAVLDRVLDGTDKETV